MDSLYYSNSFEQNLPFIMFVFIYFGFQIFSQIYYAKINTGIPSTRNYMQNFIAALVLIVIVIYYAKPRFIINMYSGIFFFVTIAFVLMFCYAKKGMDDMSEKDKRMKKDSGMKGIAILVIFLFGSLALGYIIMSLNRYQSRSDIFMVMGVALLIVGLIVAFNLLKNDVNDQNNLVLALYLYPILFLTKGLNESRMLNYGYLIIFTTVIALWGFFGVEWFTGKKEYEGVNEKVCKAYLGISDDDMISPIGKQTQTKINSRNINFIFVAIGLIFISFIVALVFVFIMLNKRS